MSSVTTTSRNRITTHVMLDLETLGVRMGSVIAVIAAIKFDPKEQDYQVNEIKEENKFYRRIDVNSCRELGFTIDPETLEWWKTQDVKVKEEIFSPDNRVPIKDALSDFGKWLGPNVKIWCQGANFDAPMLEEAYKRVGMTVPWNFWLVRDTRTLYDLAGLTQKDMPKGELHHALYDCARQIFAVKQAYKRVKRV